MNNMNMYKRISISVILTVTLIGITNCEPVLLTESYGSFHSSNYPGPYPDNVNETWQINVRDGYKIELRFTFFQLENSYDYDRGGYCIYDYVKVREGNHTLGKFCGDADNKFYFAPTPSKVMTSKQNQLNIEFISDYSNEELFIGFEAHYTEIDRDECVELNQKAFMVEGWDEMLICSQHCRNVPGSYYCTCRPHYTLHENRHTCVGNCQDKLLTGEEGEISSPGFPHQYSGLTDCNWTIRVRKGLSVNFLFDERFDIEMHPEYGCVYDWLQISYVSSQIPKQCGNATSFQAYVKTNTEQVVVQMHTDLAVSGSGFRLLYNTTRVRCHHPLVAPDNGVIELRVPENDIYEFEDVINFTCNRGYDLIGDSSLICQNDGTWSSEEPTCQIMSCGEPVNHTAIKHSSIVNTTEWVFNKTFTVVCDEWYELTSGTSEWRCLEDKSWHPDGSNIDTLPYCTPICGQRSGKKFELEYEERTQISGGRNALEGEWPWMAYVDLLDLGVDDPFEKKRFCGGTFIGEKHVITAAHCLEGVGNPLDDTKVFLGVHNRKAGEQTREHCRRTNCVQKFSVTKVQIHESYNQESFYDSDIAMLELSSYPILDYYVRPACIPKSDVEKNLVKFSLLPDSDFYKKGRIMGWGFQDETQTTATILQSATMPAVSYDLCNRSFTAFVEREGDEYPPIKINDHMICAGYPTGKSDTCNGDSGGGYFFKSKGTKKFYLMGITSFGDNSLCGGSRTYGVYTNVTNYLPWIAERVTVVV